MAIWTSRYSNRELYGNDKKYFCVGISLGAPKFRLEYKLETQCYALAPKGYMMHMGYAEFKDAYIRKLEGIGAEKILDMIAWFDETARRQGKELVLLCFEDIRNPEDWCHRTIFAQWYMEQTGEIIQELQDPNPPKSKRPAAMKTQNEDSKRPAAQQKQEADNSFQQLSLFEMAGVTI